MFRYKELIKRLDKIEEFLHVFINSNDTNQIKIEKCFKEESHNVKENVEKIIKL